MREQYLKFQREIYEWSKENGLDVYAPPIQEEIKYGHDEIVYFQKNAETVLLLTIEDIDIQEDKQKENPNYSFGIEVRTGTEEDGFDIEILSDINDEELRPWILSHLTK